MRKIYTIPFFLALLVSSCTKDDFKWNLPRKNPLEGQVNDTSGYQVPNKDAPNVITTTVTNLIESSVTVSGNITSVGSASIISYGHCWSESPMPTIIDSVSNLGASNSTGIYSSNISGLLPNTTYYVRAYATNAYGTSYGNQLAFTTNASLCGYLDCQSLAGINTFVDKISPSSSAAWVVGSGYIGNGFAITESCYGGYVEFSINLSNTTKMSFWTKSLNAGYTNRTPEVYVDGTLVNTSLINGSTSYTNWMQLQTGNILPGNHTVKINFSHNSSYYSYYIDEIQFWCQ